MENKSRRKYNGVNNERLLIYSRTDNTVFGSKCKLQYHQLIGGLRLRSFLNNPEYAGSPERVISRDSQLTLEAPRDYQGVSFGIVV